MKTLFRIKFWFSIKTKIVATMGVKIKEKHFKINQEKCALGYIRLKD